MPDTEVLEDWGPVAAGGRRRVPRRAIVVGVVAVLLLPLLFGLATGLRASAAIERVPVENLASGAGAVRHTLVVGSDSREVLSEEEQTTLTAGFVEGERTDTIFIMSTSGGKVALLALPRDLWVTRCDGTNGRINSAVQRGGPGCLVRTVRDLTGIPISHYVAVNFAGFRDVVDAVGGVELCLERAIQDPFAGVDLPAGCQTLNGTQALGYVRVRKIDNDLKRIERQQQFLRALASEATDASVVLNPFRVWGLAGAGGSALTADESLGPFDLARLGLAGRGAASGAIATHTVPVRNASIGGAAVLLPIEGEAQALFEQFRSGAVLGSLEPVREGDVTPADVRVEVRNGARITGIAGTTADALEAKGYVVVGVGNADTTATTTIRYPAGQRAAAELLADDLPVEPVLEEAAVDRVILILGQDLG